MIENESNSTNWTAYYENQFCVSAITRQITRISILKTISAFIGKQHIPLSITELGGGNSFMYEAFCRKFSVQSYNVVDQNVLGLEMFLARSNFSQNANVFNVDLLKESPDLLSDVVISIGLIEHFSPRETAVLVRRHIQLCKPGGLILITFPTPTLLYKIIRFTAELIGVWRFPDERPLQFSEVLGYLRADCKILHTSINRSIGLSQGIVLSKKFE